MKAGNQTLVRALLATVCSAFFFATLHAHPRAETAKESNAQPTANSASFQNLAAKARAAMEANRVSEAMQLYRRATNLKPDWTEGWWHLGTLSFDSGQYRQARDAFAHFVAIERKQPGPGFGMLGLSEFRLKQYSEALSALERAIRIGLGTNAEFVRTVLYYDGILHTLIGQPEMALQRLILVANQIAAAQPVAPRDAVLADEDLVKALGLAGLRIFRLPSEIATERLLLVEQAGRAEALIALQDRIAADTELKQMLALHPSEPGVHYMYGVFLLKEHPPLAVDEFRREIEVSPNSDAARIQLALEFLRTADYQEGLKYAQEAIALAPNNFVARIASGRLWLALENTDHALEELRIAVKLAPTSPDAHFALSRVLSEAGRKAEAARERAEFERLQKLAEAADR